MVTRQLAIGDIHGCYRALMALMDYVGLRADDEIITLGDYVDRGPNTRGVIDWLLRVEQSHRLIPLRGNHEIMMLAARHNPVERRYWLQVGGDATLQSYPAPGPGQQLLAGVPEEHWEFLEQRLLPSWEAEAHFFVHANAWPDVPITEQPDDMLYWEKFRDPPPHASGKIMVCGHSSQKSGLPITNGHAVCIDTWAYGGGWLTCLDVASGQLWQANERGATRQLRLDECQEESP